MHLRTERPLAAPAGMNATDWLGGRPQLLLMLLVVMFVAAGAARLYKIDAPALSVDRDFTSAIFARDFYFRHADDVELWRRDLAQATRQNQPSLEPPVNEWLVSLVYRLVGREDIRLGRVLTSCFWLIGGLFFFGTTRALVSTDAAVCALGYYLFHPMSVLLSRSVQPEALMMAMFMASLWSIVRYHQDPSRGRLISAALLTAVTLIYRPLVLFALVGAFMVPQVQRHRFWRGVLKPDSVIYVTVSVVPALIYYGYATFVAKYFGWKLASSFLLYLWFERDYWRGWLDLSLLATGAPFLILAAVGFVLLRPGLPRAVASGLAIGYLALGLVFTWHIHTHIYYHAQLIPLVALSIAPLAAALGRAAMESRSAWPRWIVVLALAAVATSWAREVDDGLVGGRFEPLETAREVGTLVNHSHRVVVVSRAYGLPIQYLGEFTGTYWPRSTTYYLQGRRGVEERLDALGFEPEYFVITFFREYNKNHADLAAYLGSHCTLKARTDEYLIYERCRRP